jgi:hypothetical protein
MVSTLTLIVPGDIPTEDAKALAIYWYEKPYSATKTYTKLLGRPGEVCTAYSTITNWSKALARDEDIHGHTSGLDAYPMTELIFWSSTRLKSPLFIQCLR